MKFTILISVSTDDGTRYIELDITDDGLPVPRIGELLLFDIGGPVEARVRDVRHWFYQQGAKVPRELYVIADPLPDEEFVWAARLESGELVRQLSALPPVQEVRLG